MVKDDNVERLSDTDKEKLSILNFIFEFKQREDLGEFFRELSKSNFAQKLFQRQTGEEESFQDCLFDLDEINSVLYQENINGTEYHE